MSEVRLLRLSDLWFRALLRLYPQDFREEHGDAMLEAYRDRCRAVLRQGRAPGLFGVWWAALSDSVWNGPGERLRPAVRWRRAGNWGRDMEITLRRLVRAPLFVAAMVGTLAVGLGVFAVVSTVVYKVLLAPLPYERPGDLYFVWRDYRAFFDLDRGWLGGTDVAELQKAGGVIEDAVGLNQDRRTLSTGAGAEPVEIGVMWTSPNLFHLLGVQPALGRGFAPDESGPDRPALIVLSHALWQRLGGADSILGQEVRLNGTPYTVIGVMPRSFSFVRHASLGSPRPTDAYATFDVKLAETNPKSGSYAGLIRARPGTTPQQVAEAVGAVGRTIDERDFEKRGLKLYPVGQHEDLVAGVRPALRVLGAAGLLLVLVLSVNLSTLLLARVMQREREIAVSRALGANAVAVMRGTLFEGAVLGTLGGAAGALAAVWATRALVALAPADLPRRDWIAMDGGVASVVIAVGALLGFLAAILPALWSVRVKLSSLLSATAVRGGGGHGRMRRGLVVAQVALSLVLLGTAGLVVRSFERLLRANPGFDPASIVSVRVPLSGQRYGESAEVIAVQERTYAALAAIPGITAISAATTLPLTAGADQTTVQIPGAPGNTGEKTHDQPLVDYLGARPGYFGVMRMRMVAGRDFAETRQEGVREAIIDRNLADTFFPPPATALGAKIPMDDTSVVVVGVVEQARQYDVDRDGRPQVYLRAEDWGYRTLYWVMRSERDAASLAPDIRAAVHNVDPELAVADLRPMSVLRDASLSQQRVSAVLVGTFALGALVLAAMGLFGVVAAAVTRRRHELAVRLALGADHGRLLRLVVGDGMRLVLVGILVGLPCTWLAGQLVRGILVGISPADPLAFVAAALGLAAVTVVACYLPARRVLGIEPSRSLRDESA